MDALEKTPLNHFLTGTNALALGTAGCNLRCQYCQNWQYSMEKPQDVKCLDMPKDEVLKAAKEKECNTICFTYTEPIVFADYVLDVATFAKSRGVRTVMATAGYVNPEPLKDLCKVIDGFCVGLKGFDTKFYDKVIGVTDFAPILKAMEIIKEQRKWLEVVTLIVPTYNDDMNIIREQCKWHKKTLGENVPLHFSRFVPEYQLSNLIRTPVKTMEQAHKIALEEGIKFVYLSNVAPHDANNTYCPKCKAAAIKRVGFKILENCLDKGKCRKCGTLLPGERGLAPHPREQ
ncbi:MAG: AmmeMemoRadiSam system radical SAM enzyme, partial [Planctomycetota bacterium]|nr:AmmeMemoRadiSam system radical SAM enzyme [Planctomycetota bacterium]